MTPENNWLIKNNPTIDEVVGLIIETGWAFAHCAIVDEIYSRFPYNQYADKAAWLHAVYNFIDKNVEYKEDEPGKEQVKTPDRFVVKDDAGDCDDYATLWVAILARQRIRHIVRIVKYSVLGSWAHVYVVVPTQNGPQIILDNVLKIFNGEVEHVRQKDY